MEITSEQVERVRKYADVSFKEAEDALTQAGGSPLDAVILLERRGRVAAPAGGTWSTRYGAPPQEGNVPAVRPGRSAACPRRRGRRYTAKEVGDAVKGFLRNCTKVSVDIWRGDDLLVGVPLIVCVLLFIVAYQIMIPLAILGLFLRCRYHISGWDWNADEINRTMDRLTDAVSGRAEKLKAEWSGKRKK